MVELKNLHKRMYSKKLLEISQPNRNLIKHQIKHSNFRTLSNVSLSHIN